MTSPLLSCSYGSHIPALSTPSSGAGNRTVCSRRCRRYRKAAARAIKPTVARGSATANAMTAPSVALFFCTNGPLVGSVLARTEADDIDSVVVCPTDVALVVTVV